MSETSNINIIYGPEVAGNIAIHLKKVPFDEAFGTIMNLKGLVASQLGENILRVTTPDVMQREQAKAVVFTKSIAVNYLKAEDMQKHVQAVMSSAGRKGTITVVQETNSIVVTDSQEGIAQAERLVAQLDKKPAQVMIEARLVEINLNNGFDIGVQWEFFNSRTSGDRTSNIGLNSGEDARVKIKTINPVTGEAGDDIGAVSPSNGGTGVNLPGPGGAGIAFGFVNNDSILQATLNALVTQSKAKILSAPKVVTINGQQAKIEAVQDIPFRTAVVSANGAVTQSFTTVSAGIILTVTPTINAEDRISLKVMPESSFPIADSTEQGGAGPTISTRRAQTTVTIKDGETLVIGGLISDQDTKAVSKVPILGDIPIIGVFFRSQSNRKIRNELLVFVTPRIIRE
jgi:type IV pilus assembly protein PilQ